MIASSFRYLMALGAILTPLVITGCTTAKEPLIKEVSPQKSSFSNFLVAQYAIRENQMQTASEFLAAVSGDKETPQQIAKETERQLFTLLIQEGRMEEALKIIDQLDEQTLMGDMLRVVHSIKMNDYKKAATQVDALPTQGLASFIKPLLEAWTKASINGVDEGLKALSSLEKQEGLETLYNLHAALLNEHAGRLEKAKEHYDKALNGPDALSIRLVELYGTLLLKMNKPDEAYALFNPYFEMHPDSFYVQAMMDLLKSGKLAQSKEITISDGVSESLFGLASSLRSPSTRQIGLILGRMSLYLNNDMPIAQILIAELLEANQRYEDANVEYRKISSDSPFSWSARLRVALNLEDIGQPDDAIDVLKGMVKQYPERLEAILTLADVQRHQEYFEEAQKNYKKAIDLVGNNLAPHHWNLFYSRGIALERLKRWDEAEPMFLKALELEHEQPHVLNYLGYSWIEQGTHLDQAKKMIERAVEQRPRDGFIVDSLGWVLYRLGEYDKALKHLERAVELQPSDPIINDHLGDVYWKVGRKREARFQWFRAKSLNPQEKDLEVIEQKLDNGLQSS